MKRTSETNPRNMLDHLRNRKYKKIVEEVSPKMESLHPKEGSYSETSKSIQYNLTIRCITRQRMTTETRPFSTTQQPTPKEKRTAKPVTSATSSENPAISPNLHF